MKNSFKLFVILYFFLAQTSFGQESILSPQQLQEQIKIQPRPTLLLIHTDWCKYCALQKQQINTTDKKIKNKVYIAAFNAEQKEDIIFKDKTYRYKANGRNTGIHELVGQLAKDTKVAFPLWIILDENLNVLDRYAGYLRPKELEEIVEKL